MAYLLDLPTFTDPRGSLTVLDNIIPFEIKRVYYIYNASAKRGGHRHKKNIQCLIALQGSCEIFVNNGREKKVFVLDNPSKGLILETVDWHTMDNFKNNCILLVLASEHYDKNDYIDEEYPS
ncbi:FdtA/QdtA family cupin domain-containing protein [Treponema sp. J25]|uniref:sugar 3,4-ketoisomerase n=1 Tax=Treponema sp. J25 TaxID=2094121 RepID=UPI001048BA1B|nr:FdtA/QdtA family cupin domain-containing protein [Treponema sp. J25]TCW60527.1 hypothetical protein C5O22_11115 [Treponema sp. J25]